MKTLKFLLAGAATVLASAAFAQGAAPAASASGTANAAAPWPEAWFEIFKLAPGKQEEFIRRIDRADQVAATAGLPPIQIFVHEDGADWDVLLFKPVTGFKPTTAQEAAMAAKRKELHMESGPAYFLGIRETIASHTDSKAYGLLSAAQWLDKLDKWRAENPQPAQK
ncbi:hypothetical protein [Novosphingobium resinovorum]|uniref:Uncharacterized protein n=1 Tax=Novosphingobium resinovorum TaxID=158500 RepID=A0A031J5F3_9SPHN|nr:hypothetical protein [Novosphingobium resinovorum]AOR79389.1 hypothetical protein BES08_21350 [Novosphingobium resinovorum]EZP68512.1 hypothetical protein BV97_05620 [Novosphingobium resinovorum]